MEVQNTPIGKNQGKGNLGLNVIKCTPKRSQNALINILTLKRRSIVTYKFIGSEQTVASNKSCSYVVLAETTI